MNIKKKKGLTVISNRVTETFPLIKQFQGRENPFAHIMRKDGDSFQKI